jgi:PAS domain S-box-containing protein
MNNLSVLIAGTSSSYLEISKKMLKFHYSSCEVDIAHSGQECLDKSQAGTYDIILFDYDLGDMNGLQVIDKIRAYDARTPLIILVDEGRDDIATLATERGASDYVLKVRGYLTALPITIRNIVERSLIKAESTYIPKTDSAVREATGYFILDRRGRILSANHSMSELTNYTEDELLELSLPDLLPKEKEKSFYDWFNTISHNGNSKKSFRTEILGKRGGKKFIDIQLTAIKDENQRIVSYRGQFERLGGARTREIVSTNRVDQLHMISQVAQILTSSYWEPFNVVLENIIETAGRSFRFQRATLALLDRRKNAFVKQAMIGYSNISTTNGASMEVPHEVIERVFHNKYRVKVLYYNQSQNENTIEFNSEFYERRTQKRRQNNQWHKRDLILVNLLTSSGKTFGYISLDDPAENFTPSRDTFHNLELFGQLVSMIVENYYQFSTIEKRSRRLKQILVTSNIFKLHLSLNDLLKEMVWSIKFSLDFNLVALGLISKKEECLELKAVACDDRVKLNQLGQLKFSLGAFANLFRSEYLRNKSYFVVKEERVLNSLKQIYHNGSLHQPSNGGWPSWGVILVPLKSRDGKVIGVLMVDDPEDRRLPSKEVFSTLEILANQVAVAVDNRVMYIQAKKQLQEYEKAAASAQVELPDYSNNGMKRLLHRLFN